MEAGPCPASDSELRWFDGQAPGTGNAQAVQRTAGAAGLRVALVTPMLPVEHDPTRGRYIHETARALSKQACVKVFFQTLRYPRIPGVSPRSYLYGDVDAGYRLDGIDVEAFDYLAVPVLSRGLNAMSAAMALAPRVRRFAPDVVLGYWVYPDGAAALRVARGAGVPCVVGALGSDIHVRDGVSAMLTRRTIARADALVTVSEAMRRTAIDDFGADPTKVHTVVNGYNTNVFRPMDQVACRRQTGLAYAEKVIVYVGRFVEAKGLVELVDAFRALARDDASVRLVLIGDGVMKQRLHTLVDASGVGDRITLPGAMEPPEVARWINASDVLVLPSWSEGYPNVVVEALACGRPVVATDVGGTREIVGPTNGIMVRPKQVDELRAALERALATRWDRVAIAAAMRRSWDDVASETLRICDALVERNRQETA